MNTSAEIMELGRKANTKERGEYRGLVVNSILALIVKSVGPSFAVSEFTTLLACSTAQIKDEAWKLMVESSKPEGCECTTCKMHELVMETLDILRTNHKEKKMEMFEV